MMKQVFLRHPLLPSILYFPCYMLWFHYLQERSVPRIWIFSQLDLHIPFCSWFVIPYLLWFLFVAGTVIYFSRSPEECLRLSAFLYLGMTVCLVIYTVLPNGQLLRPAIPPDDGLLTQIVFLVYHIDPPINVCPSIHVFATLGVQGAIWRSPGLKKKRSVQLATSVLSVLIILSTVFLKQHSVIDVMMAFLLGGVMNLLIYRLPESSRTGVPAYSVLKRT